MQPELFENLAVEEPAVRVESLVCTPDRDFHPNDARATDALKSIPGLDKLLAKILEYGLERLFYVENVASNVRVTPKMFGLLKEVVDRWLVVPEPRLKSAIPELASNAKVVAEGAGATSVAAALKGGARAGRVVCVVSGGNIDAAKLSKILSGQIP